MELPHLPYTQFSEGHGVSGDGGEVVGFGWGDVPAIAFAVTDTRVVGLNDPHCGWFSCAGPGAFAQAISMDGSTVVGYLEAVENDPPIEAFRRTSQEGVVRLGWLRSDPYIDSQAFAVSGDGSVIVGNSGSSAFVWDAAHGMRNLQHVLSVEDHLDLSGWHLWRATGISSDGSTIVGYGYNQNAVPATDEAWIAHL